MTDSRALERRYRRLLIWFPAEHRREYAEEMISVLLTSTPQGRRRPRPADAFDLMTGGLRARLRRRGAGISDARLPDALIALRYRRTATAAALVAAAWFWFLLVHPLTVWIDGLEASYCVALLVQVIALAGSPGPRRAVAIMTWKTWLVLSAAGATMGAASIYYPWSLSTWLAAAVVFAFLAAVGAGLVVTLPTPTALRLLLLLAVPAVPCAVWVLQFTAAMAGNASPDPFPVLTFLPVLLLACVSAARAWQARHGSKTA